MPQRKTFTTGMICLAKNLIQYATQDFKNIKKVCVCCTDMGYRDDQGKLQRSIFDQSTSFQI